MERYEIVRQWHTIMNIAKDGDWVKYEDVKKLVRDLLTVFSDMNLKISDEEIEVYINEDILEGMLKHSFKNFLGV